MKRVLAGFVVVCALMVWAPVIFGSVQEVITPHDLLKAFIDNPDAAKAQYLGKVVQVKGIVISKGMSIYVTPNVMLSDHEEGTAQAICVLPRLDVGKLSDFTVGQSVTMSGKVYNMSESRIVLKECKAVEYDCF